LNALVMTTIASFCDLIENNVINLNEDQRRCFYLFYKILLDGNKKINLVSRKEPDIIGRHFINSAVIAYYKKFSSSDFILDIGTGGGFPGMILKILFPDTNFVLVDSTRKKTDFLHRVSAALNLKKIEILNERVENLGIEFRSKFDFITCRAVGELDKLVTWSVPYLKDGGEMLFLKGRRYAEELQKNIKNVTIRTYLLDDLDFLQEKHGGVLIEAKKRAQDFS